LGRTGNEAAVAYFNARVMTEGTGEDYGKPQSWEPISDARNKPGISQIRVKFSNSVMAFGT